MLLTAAVVVVTSDNVSSDEPAGGGEDVGSAKYALGLVSIAVMLHSDDRCCIPGK